MVVSDISAEAKAWIGINEDSELFQRLSQAIEEIGFLGNYDYRVGTIDLNPATDCATYTLPRWVDAVLAVNVCGNPTIPRDRWYEFNQSGNGSNKTETWVWDDKMFVPTYQDLRSPSHLGASNVLKNDENTVIQVFGVDNQGVTLRTQNLDGSWQDGLQIVSYGPTDFPLGLPTDDPTRLLQRYFSTVPSTTLNVPNHTFITGEQVVYAYISGTALTPLVSGSTYFVSVVDSNNVSLYYTQSNALTQTSPIVLTTLSSSSTYSLTDTRGISVQTAFQTPAAHNLSVGSLVSFTGSPLPTPLTSSENFYAHPLTTTTFTIHNTLSDAKNNVNPVDVSSPGTSVNVLAQQLLQPVTTLAFSVHHNFLTGDVVTVSNSTGNLPAPLVAGTQYYTYYITATTLSLHTSLNEANLGTNPIILTTNGSGVTSLVKTIPASVTSGDTNNVTATNHNLTSGDLLSFTTTGTLPTPIAQGTVYQCTTPNSSNTFTVASTGLVTIGSYSVARAANVATIVTSTNHGFLTGDLIDIEGFSGGNAGFNANLASITVTNATTFTYSNTGGNVATVGDSSGSCIRGRINIVSLGSGQLNVIVSRAFTVGFTNSWFTDTSLLTTGTAIQVTTTGSLPTTSPTISVGVTYYIRVGTTNLVTIYDTQAHAIAGGATGLVSITALGVNNTYLSLIQSVTPILRTNNLNISSNTYLSPTALGTLTTNGSLPAPLATSTVYQLRTNTDGSVTILNANTQVPITLSGIGNGQHNFNISSLGGIALPNTLSCLLNEYTTGDAVTVSAYGATSVLPAPFVYGTTYYIRRIDNNTVQFYPSWAQAVNTSSTSGVVIPTTAGTGNFVINKFVAMPYVARIDRVRKPVTLGQINLYAWDNCRSCNGPTILGTYEPDEIEPSYRRIRVGYKNAPVRVAFRRRSFQITSMNDYIPVTSRLALFTMLKAVQFLRDDFIDQYKIFKNEAKQIIEEEQSVQEGPGSIQINFNQDIMTAPHDSQMDTDFGGLGNYGGY